MGRFLGQWLVTFLAVLIVGWLLPMLVQFTDWANAAVFALVLAILNAAVRPVLVVLTLPLTCLTLGLFALVINAVMFWAAATVVPGVQVAGFLEALVAALVVSVISTLIGMVIR